VNAAATQTPDRRHATNFHSDPQTPSLSPRSLYMFPLYCRTRVDGVNTFRCIRRSPHVVSRRFASSYSTFPQLTGILQRVRFPAAPPDIRGQAQGRGMGVRRVRVSYPRLDVAQHRVRLRSACHADGSVMAKAGSGFTPTVLMIIAMPPKHPIPSEIQHLHHVKNVAAVGVSPSQRRDQRVAGR
jgi:hypothetical protein